MTTRILDWRPSHDDRSRNYPVRSLIGSVERRDRQWSPGVILDQGREGACVGFAWASEAFAEPVPVDIARLRAYVPQDPTKFALFLYGMAQHIDEWPGQSYSGTSVLAGAKAAWNVRLLWEYRWAFGTDDAIDTVCAYGPVVIGVNWYSGMYTAPGGVLKVSGTLVGGHALLVTGYTGSDPKHGGGPSVTLKNSWGPGWGINGLATMSVADFTTLLAQNGEACVPVSRSYGRS